MNRRTCIVLALALGIGCNKAPSQAAATPAPPASVASPAAPAASPVAALPASPTPKPVPAELPAVVARVNGEAIERADLDGAVKAVTARSGGVVPPGQRDALYRGVLEQLVAYRLLALEGKARSVAVTDAEVTSRVAEVRKQFPTEDAFKKALASQGMSAERLPKELRMNLLVTKLLEAELAPKTAVAPQDVEKFYQENPQHFKEPEAIKASHILIRVAEGADEAAKKKARADAEAVLKQVKGGADFAALAKQHSQDPGSAAKGGDLGFFGKGQMVPAFESAALALKPGETSGIVETPFGFHIIKLAERRPERTVPLQEVSQKISQFLKQQKKQQGTEAFVAQLKAKGKVEILI